MHKIFVLDPFDILLPDHDILPHILHQLCFSLFHPKVLDISDFDCSASSIGEEGSGRDECLLSQKTEQRSRARPALHQGGRDPVELH